MSVTRRTVLQGSLLGVAGMLEATPTIAQWRPPEPTSEERQRLARLAADFMDFFEVPGLSVAIAINGEPAYVEAFGLADKENGEKLTPQHRFRIASVTKPITSTGVFSLIEAGKLSLTDRVFGPNSVLGDDYKTPPDRQQIELITIEHLLTHTAGGWSNDSHDPMFTNNQMNHRELITWTLLNQPLASEPGRSFAYSNFGYCLLGRVIEKIANQSYEKYIVEHILNRCDVSDMQIAGNTLADRAVNEVKYYNEGSIDPYGMNVTRMDSHGGWIARPTDLVRFLVHIDGFGKNQLLSSDTLKSMTTPTEANPRYAKGFFVNKANNWWHSGSLPGTLTVAVRTHSNFCWAAFTNIRSRFEDMSASLDQFMWHMVGNVSSWRA